MISFLKTKQLAVYQQALSAGAISVTEMTSLLWGDRGGRVRDPLGNVWWIQTHVENVNSEEMAKRATEKQYLDVLWYTRKSFDREMRSRGYQKSQWDPLPLVLIEV